MNRTDLPSSIRLGARRVFEIADAGGMRIECPEGSVWLTLDHDSRDIVLEPGDSFTGTEHSRVLVYAFEASRITLLAAEPARTAEHLPGQRSRTTAQVSV